MYKTWRNLGQNHLDIERIWNFQHYHLNWHGFSKGCPWVALRIFAFPACKEKTRNASDNDRSWRACTSFSGTVHLLKGTLLIFAKGRLHGTRWCEKCLQRDASRKGHCYGMATSRPNVWTELSGHMLAFAIKQVCRCWCKDQVSGL